MKKPVNEDFLNPSVQFRSGDILSRQNSSLRFEFKSIKDQSCFEVECYESNCTSNHPTLMANPLTLDLSICGELSKCGNPKDFFHDRFVEGMPTSGDIIWLRNVDENGNENISPYLVKQVNRKFPEKNLDGSSRSLRPYGSYIKYDIQVIHLVNIDDPSITSYLTFSNRNEPLYATKENRRNILLANDEVYPFYQDAIDKLLNKC